MARIFIHEGAPLALLYLALTGNISKKDLELYLIDKPKLATVLYDFYYYCNKYRKRVVVNYLWNIMSKYKEDDILKRLRLLSIDISFVGSDRLKTYTPYLVELAAMIEKKAREYGVLDHRLEQAFEDLYRSIQREKVRPSEIIAALTRIYTLVELSGTQARGSAIHRIEDIQPVIRPSYKDYNTTSESKGNHQAILTFLKHVKECEEQGNNLISKVISSFFSKHSNLVNNIAEVYSLYKECVRKNLVSIDNKRRISLSDKGKKYINEE